MPVNPGKNETYLLVLDDSVHSYLVLCVSCRDCKGLHQYSRLAGRQYHIFGYAMETSVDGIVEVYSGLPTGIPLMDYMV